MKKLKFLTIILALLLSFALIACPTNSNTNDDNDDENTSLTASEKWDKAIDDTINALMSENPNFKMEINLEYNGSTEAYTLIGDDCYVFRSYDEDTVRDYLISNDEGYLQYTSFDNGESYEFTERSKEDIDYILNQVKTNFKLSLLKGQFDIFEEKDNKFTASVENMEFYFSEVYLNYSEYTVIGDEFYVVITDGHITEMSMLALQKLRDNDDNYFYTAHFETLKISFGDHSINLPDDIEDRIVEVDPPEDNKPT